MEEAERIAKYEHQSMKISVISGAYVCCNVCSLMKNLVLRIERFLLD